MLVLAGFDEHGFDFATDDRSPKIEDARRQPWVALVFYWAELDRQVRIEGELAPLDEAAAEQYFHRRARAAQLAAWVGQQSAVVAERPILEEQLLRLLAEQEHQAVGRPPSYRAYRVAPTRVEFWQLRSDQLHDRVRYRQAEPGAWIIERLAP
jgi:pyridoxamine 5'-phosphate oxidase